MKCPFCGFTDTQVKDSRPSEVGDIIRRRRSCTQCGARFTTLEKKEIREIKVVKKSGAKRLFDEAKLLLSIRIATRKRPVIDEVIEGMVANITKNIEKNVDNEISTKTIGKLVMEELAKIDQVAYVRYASVYKDFNSIQDFNDFIMAISKNEKKD